MFDNMCDEFGVQKVETAGDCYIAAAGILQVGACGGERCMARYAEHELGRVRWAFRVKADLPTGSLCHAIYM